MKTLGELFLIGTGDPIPLLKRELTVGRRENCDIVFRHADISAHHCHLSFRDGYWHAKDLESKNGIRLNGTRCMECWLKPGDTFAIAKHEFEIQYSPGNQSQHFNEPLPASGQFTPELLIRGTPVNG